MIRNYFKIAWRNLWKNKTFTALNLSALTISLAACLIIFFWICYELSFDKSGVNADRVFRVALKLEIEKQPVKEFAVTAPPLMPALVKDFLEIESAVRLTGDNPLIGYKQQNFFTDRFYYADTTFFKVFGYPLLKGDPNTILTDINSAVITESIAEKLFGNNEPIGQLITMNDTTLLKVSGVAKDLPLNNHFYFDIIVPMKLLERQLGPNGMSGWWNDSYYTYVLLKDPKDAAALDAKIAGIIDKYNGKQNKELGLKGTHYLQPLRGIHLHSDLRGELNPNGNIQTLRILGFIAFFLLLVACINYVNLTTATSFKRSKEIGIKKVTGATVLQLMTQLLTEAIVVSNISITFAVVLAISLLPLFNKLAGTQVNIAAQISLQFALGLVVFSILLGIAAGFFPSFYLSRIKPLITIRKSFLKPASSFSLRKVLVVFQFSITVTLIISTIIAFQQLGYMQTRDLGFSKDQVLNIPLRNQAESISKERLKSNFQSIPGISGTASSSSVPGGRLANITVLPEGVSRERWQTMATLIVDYDFIRTYDMSMAAGRGFSKEYGGDSSAFILNETAVRELGWGDPQNAIGKGFVWGGGKEGKIIGVAKDFHFNSLQQKVQPMVMHLLPDWDWYSNLSVRLSATNVKAAIHSLETEWNRILPGHPFDYSFVDEDYNKQYKTEQQLSSLSATFSILIIFISCLGLLGLTIVAVSQRTKEIGVRKVLGASVSGIAALLSKDFVKLVLIAIVIASPLAWWLMNEWLTDFAYRINIKWWVFAVAGVIAVFIALVTVSSQAIKAGIANPVKSLRTE